jgi:hypothetical protein
MASWPSRATAAPVIGSAIARTINEGYLTADPLILRLKPQDKFYADERGL